jgi:TorA maturation chaperone TorD
MTQVDGAGTEVTGGRTWAAEELPRADAWSILGKLLAAPPKEPLLDLLTAVDAEAVAADNLLGAAWEMLAAAAGRSSPAALEEEYQDLFIGVGRGELMPYGSWYMTGFLMEQPLARLRSELGVLGFERQQGVCEPEDHAAAVCEVMAMISTGEEAVPVESQAGFFSRHVAPWMGRFFRDMQQAPSASFYRAVGQLGEQFVALEAQFLNASVQAPTGGPRQSAGLA